MRFYILVALCLLGLCRAQAQSGYVDSLFVTPATKPPSADTVHKKIVPLYMQVKTNAGFLFAGNPSLNQTFIVPYTSSVLTGTQVLTTNQNNITGKNFTTLGGGLQIGMGRYFFIDFAINSLLATPKLHSNSNLITMAGQTTLGSNIPLHFKQNRYMLQLAATLNETNYTINLGQISNSNATIQVLGEQAGPTFYYKSSGQKNQIYNYAGNVNATQLLLTYHNTQMYLAPKVSFGNNPFKYHFHWAVSLYYNIPLYKDEYITIQQDGAVPGKTTFTNNLPNASLTNPGVALYSNQAKSTSTPYMAKGFSAFITVGYNFINGPSHKKKPTPKVN